MDSVQWACADCVLGLEKDDTRNKILVRACRELVALDGNKFELL